MGRPKKIKSEEYFPTERDRRAMSWCLERNIRCYHKPADGEYKVVFEYVEDNKIKKVESPGSYDKYESSKVIWGLYRHQYEKSNGKVG